MSKQNVHVVLRELIEYVPVPKVLGSRPVRSIVNVSLWLPPPSSDKIELCEFERPLPDTEVQIATIVLERCTFSSEG
jgi:hypothetical protein